MIGLWLVAVAGGSAALLRYERTPGNDAASLPVWPVESHLGHSRVKPTLVMFVHPECGCTQASLKELDELVARHPGEFEVQVVVVDLVGLPAEAEESSIWRAASAIPGVSVVRDFNGTEARAFRGSTSGRTLVYDAAGQLRFDGGITAARGQIGANAGTRALDALVSGEAPQTDHTAVFGCPLFSPKPSNP